MAHACSKRTPHLTASHLWADTAPGETSEGSASGAVLC